MPRYRPETERARAKSLTKSLIDNGLSQTAVARKEGVTPQAINQRLKHLPVQKSFAEMMDKEGLTDNYLRKKLKEGLEANKVVGYLNNKVDGTQKVSDEFVEVPDLHCRHKYLVTALELKKYLKHNGSNGVNVSTIIFNFKAPEKLLSSKEHDLLANLSNADNKR